MITISTDPETGHQVFTVDGRRAYVIERIDKRDGTPCWTGFPQSHTGREFRSTDELEVFEAVFDMVEREADDNARMAFLRSEVERC